MYWDDYVNESHLHMLTSFNIQLTRHLRLGLKHVDLCGFLLVRTNHLKEMVLSIDST